MDRREFLAKAGLAATWAGVSISVGACSSDSGGDPGTGPPTSNDVTGVVTGGGHTHGGAVVTEAQIMDGQAVQLTLDLSGHTHTLDLTAQQVMDIGAGTQIVALSSRDSGHTHTVTFN